MTKHAVNSTSIEVNKKYLAIITSYLESNNYNFNISNASDDDKLRLEIIGLDSEAAFYLGVQTQIQLVDGEFLI